MLVFVMELWQYKNLKIILEILEKKVKCKRLMNIQISYFTKSELSASFIRQSMQFPDKEEINSNPIQNLDTGPP